LREAENEYPAEGERSSAMNMIRILAVGAMIAAATACACAADQTWTGSLVDASCYLKDGASMASGNNHMGMKDCGTVCLKMGQPAGILTPEKQLILLVLASPSVAEFVGQPIRVTGTLKNGAIVVTKFEVKKGAGWKTIKLPDMM
jgi:hypothetical protein